MSGTMLSPSLHAAPEMEPIHFLIPGSAGGGWEGTARGTREALTKSSLVGTASFHYVPGGGGMMEDNLRRALLINDDSLSFLWHRPITLTIMLVTLIILIAPLFQRVIKRALKIDSGDRDLTIN